MAFGALAKAFGGAGKAIGKGAKKGFMGMKDRMNQQPESGGVDTGPSQSPMRPALSNIMKSVATAGQPDTARNQVPFGPQMNPMDMFQGGGINPAITSMILRKVYGGGQPPMPTNPGTGQNMGYAAQDGMVNNPNMGVLGPNPAGMDAGPPNVGGGMFDTGPSMMPRNRMPGMFR